jgi:regulator of replication initiation timing
METADSSLVEAAKLKSEIDTLRRHIQTLLAENERLRRKLESTWGEA